MRQPAQHRIGLAAAKPDGAFESRHLLVEGQSRGALGAVARVKVFTSPAGYPSGSREDPVIWCSGGQYHLVYNYYDLRKARHMVSPDGIKNWRAPHFHRVGIRIRLRSGLADSLAETTIVSCPEIVGGALARSCAGDLLPSDLCQSGLLLVGLHCMFPLVFFPGAGGRADFWRPVADRLASAGPTLRLAWPGFGDRPADPSIGSLDALYLWILRQLPAGPVHLVAQSMGGVLATRLAIEHPERVATLVLCATSGGVDVASLGGADWRPAFRAELPDVPDWFEIDRTDLTARLGAICAPTLVLNGDEDAICPPAVARLLCGRIPGARAQVLPRAAHDFAHQRPDEVAEAIRRHIVAVPQRP